MQRHRWGDFRNCDTTLCVVNRTKYFLLGCFEDPAKNICVLVNQDKAQER